jgi:hypothetical protein
MEHGLDRRSVKAIADDTLIVVVGTCICGNVNGCERTYTEWVYTVWDGQQRVNVRDV